MHVQKAYMIQGWMRYKSLSVLDQLTRWKTLTPLDLIDVLEVPEIIQKVLQYVRESKLATLE